MEHFECERARVLSAFRCWFIIEEQVSHVAPAALAQPDWNAPELARASLALGAETALRAITFESHCEHLIMPVIGKAHVAYLSTSRVVGISKLARVVEAYAKRLQIQ